MFTVVKRITWYKLYTRQELSNFINYENKFKLMCNYVIGSNLHCTWKYETNDCSYKNMLFLSCIQSKTLIDLIVIELMFDKIKKVFLAHYNILIKTHE